MFKKIYRGGEKKFFLKKYPPPSGGERDRDLRGIDTWVFCSAGYYQNTLSPTQWITKCGDGFRAGSEKCDDGNTLSGDGCLGDCSSVEAGCVCIGGSPTSKDTWTKWGIGFYQNDASNPTLWVSKWGDSIKVISEAWDDGNLVSGDGCSSTWTIEYGFVWSGGTIYVKDTWVDWTTGFYPNADQSQWVPHCGDSKRAGSEAWDDGNTANGDGWSSSWTVETGASWYGGSITSKDTWVFCNAGYYQNTLSPTQWITKCGDGFRAGSEKCDDSNTSSGDGCLGVCSSVEAGWVCTGGSPTSKDTCIKWNIGFYQNDASNPILWIPKWGDGIRVSTETWDDGNLISGDGCSSVCTIESGFAWSGGSIYIKDTWVAWTSGLYTNTDQSQCIPHCGDGFRAGSEKCDDGNTSSSDGCLNDCSSVEAGFVCSGGSPTSKDTCIKWDRGFYQNDVSNPTQWVPKWGDGLRVSYEHWDDGNLISEDGWSFDCMEIESGWAWFGGYFGVTDVWVQCDLGYDPNPDYSKCIGATVPRDVNAMAAASQIGAITGVSSNLVLTVFSSSSSSSSNSFGMLNQIQLVIFFFNILK